MRYQPRKAELENRASLRASHAASAVIRPATDASAPRRIDPLPPAPPLVARLNLPRARWQNKNALIYPIIYVSPDAALEQAVLDSYPQLIALAPPDLWDPMPAPVAPPVAAPPPVLVLPPPLAPKPTAPAPPAAARLFANYDQPRKPLSVAVPLLLVAVLLLFVATYVFTIR